MELQSSRSVRIASYRRKLPRKKNIYLPTEVWVDVFCYPWTTRKKMAQMVDKIGNRWFGEQLQFYLHEWGKHTLGNLYFKPQGVNYCWHYQRHNYQRQLLEYPQTTMPKNIKFSKSFEINHFDNRVFNFFRRIQSLLTADTKLEIRYIYKEYSGYAYAGENDVADQVGNTSFILGHLLPFIDGIHTIYTDDWMMPIVQSFPAEKFHKIKVFDVSNDYNRPIQLESTIQPAMKWLTTSNNEPKLLQLTAKNEIAQRVLETIRKQFMEATEPFTFAVHFSNKCNLPAFKCENAIGEQLYGIRNESDVEKATFTEFKVFRHQANAEAGDKLRQWVNANINRKQCIRIRTPFIWDRDRCIFAMPDLDEEEAIDEKEEDEKPSSSKKMLICK